MKAVTHSCRFPGLAGEIIHKMRRHLATTLQRAIMGRPCTLFPVVAAEASTSALTALSSNATAPPAALAAARAAAIHRSSCLFRPFHRAFAVQTAGRPAAPGDGVQLSDGAVARLQELTSQSGEPVVLRLTVEGGGCSGFQYEFSLDSSARDGDRCDQCWTTWANRRGEAVLQSRNVFYSS